MRREENSSIMFDFDLLEVRGEGRGVENRGEQADTEGGDHSKILSESFFIKHKKLANSDLHHIYRNIA